MRVLSTGIDAQFRVLLASQRAFFRQHALHGHFDGAFREAAGKDFAGRGRLDAARVAGVAVVDFVGQLVAGELCFLRIDHDDMVTGIDVRSKVRAVLAAQALGDVRSKTSDNDISRVDHDPLILDVHGCVIGFHRSTQSLSLSEFMEWNSSAGV